MPSEVATSASGGSSYGDVLQLGPAERYLNHSATPAHRLVSHCDSEEPSSEDEDGDEDLLPQESFPSKSVVLHERTPH